MPANKSPKDLLWRGTFVPLCHWDLTSQTPLLCAISGLSVERMKTHQVNVARRSAASCRLVSLEWKQRGRETERGSEKKGRDRLKKELQMAYVQLDTGCFVLISYEIKYVDTHSLKRGKLLLCLMWLKYYKTWFILLAIITMLKLEKEMVKGARWQRSQEESWDSARLRQAERENKENKKSVTDCTDQFQAICRELH